MSKKYNPKHGLPEPIEGYEPECPNCNLVYEMPQEEDESHRFDCDCGCRFEAVKKTIIVSRPMEIRN